MLKWSKFLVFCGPWLLSSGLAYTAIDLSRRQMGPEALGRSFQPLFAGR
jgi:hypothetical protein